MRLNSAIELYAREVENHETPQRDNAGLEGKKWRVVDKPGWGYGNQIAGYDTREEAEQHSLAAPGTKVVRNTSDLRNSPKNRRKQLEHVMNTNPDLDLVDGSTAAPVSPGSSLQKRNDEVDTPRVMDKIRQRRVRTTPNVD